MPIRADQKARYPADWPAISKRIKERDGNACKWCKVPNGALIMRGEGTAANTYMMPNGDVHDDKTGERMGRARGSEYGGRFVKIVLTVAHIHDHAPENCADENLAALCQKCHLNHDHQHHQANAAATRRSRKAHKDLFS